MTRRSLDCIGDWSRRLFATGSADRNVTIWDPAGTAVVTLPQTRPVQRLFWSSDGRLLSLLAPGERAVRQWRIDALKAEFLRLGLEDGSPEMRPVTLAGKTRDDNALKMKLVWCPPGRCLMGSPEEDQNAESDEKPQVEVTTSRGFWLGQTEVTRTRSGACWGLSH